MDKNDILTFLKQHKTELSERFGLEKIALFGSFATGFATEKSDIDILVEMNHQGSIFERKNDLRLFLENAFGKKVDIAREKYIKPYIKDEILRVALYV